MDNLISRRDGGSVVLSMLMFLVFLHNTPARAQDIAVPIDIQYPLIFKILSFDRSLAERSGEEIVIAVVYQDRFRTSRATKEAFMEMSKRDKAPAIIQGVSVRFIEIDIESLSDLEKALEKQPANVLFVTPLRALGIPELAAMSKERGILTIASAPEYVYGGLSVGIDQKDNRPEIIINTDSARAEGAQLSGRLLQLARLISD